MKRNLADVPHNRQQQSQNPGIERRMRVTLHVDQVSSKHIPDVMRMGRLDLRVLRAVEIVNVVALDRLIKKRCSQQHNHRQREQQFHGFQRSTGRRAAPTSSTLLVRVRCGAVFTSCGSVSASLAIEIMERMNTSISCLLSVSVGSIIRAP